METSDTTSKTYEVGPVLGKAKLRKFAWSAPNPSKLNPTAADTKRRAVKRMAGLSEPIQTVTCFSKK